MTTKAVTIQTDTAVQAAAKLWLKHRVSAVDAKSDVVGIVSEGDVMRRVAADIPNGHLGDGFSARSCGRMHGPTQNYIAAGGVTS